MTNRTHDLQFNDTRIGVFDLRNVRRVDWLLVLLTLLLAVGGLVILYSATRSVDTLLYRKQAVFFVLGAGIGLLIVCIDHRFLVTLAPLMYCAAVLVLVAVLMMGKGAKGAERWLAIGPVRLQPSELCKLIMVYSLAWYFTAVGPRIQRLPFFLLTFVVTMAPAVLILKQPNLSTAASMIPITVSMLYVAGCKRWHLFALILMGIAAIPIAYSHIEGYQRERVDTFLNPGSDPGDAGWQTLQAKISIGSGGLTGKGFGNVTETELSFLPEYHNDLIFSVLAEEFGFVGGALVIGLFAAFLLRGLYHAATNPDMSGTLVATGAVAILGFHVFVNIAMTIGLMPVTGIPLPFLSYGGSFCLTTMMCVAVLLNASIRKGFFG